MIDQNDFSKNRHPILRLFVDHWAYAFVGMTIGAILGYLITRR